VSRRRFTPREAVNVAARAVARVRGWDCPDDLDVVLAAEEGDQRAREMALLGEAAALALLGGEAGGGPWVAGSILTADKPDQSWTLKFWCAADARLAQPEPPVVSTRIVGGRGLVGGPPRELLVDVEVRAPSVALARAAVERICSPLIWVPQPGTTPAPSGADVAREAECVRAYREGASDALGGEAVDAGRLDGPALGPGLDPAEVAARVALAAAGYKPLRHQSARELASRGDPYRARVELREDFLARLVPALDQVLSAGYERGVRDAAREALPGVTPAVARSRSATCPGCGAGVELVGRAADLIPEPAEGEEDEEVLRRLRVECAVLGRDCLNLAAALEEAPTDEELAAVRAADPVVAWWFAQLRPEAVRDAIALFLSVRRRGVSP
jgi:hypothetical protein